MSRRVMSGRGLCEGGFVQRGLCPEGFLSDGGMSEGVTSGGGYVRRRLCPEEVMSGGGYVRRRLCLLQRLYNDFHWFTYMELSWGFHIMKMPNSRYVSISKFI